MTGRIIEGAQLRLGVSARSDVGECRRAAKRLAEQYRFDDTSVGRICIIANELANNIVSHAGSGEFLVQMLDDGSNPELELLAIDNGPGMKDVEQCLRDGYSTAGTPGTGLGAISRLSTIFDVFSVVDQGTVVLSRTTPGRAPQRAPATVKPALEFGAICLAITGETECGDAWRIAESDNAIAALVADGLGHGPLAATASQAACKAYSAGPFDEPSRIMEGLHRALSGTRGAAAACVILRIPQRKAVYAGVGNICGRILASERSQGMVSHNGTLGVQLLRTQQFEYGWPEDSRVVMHSDGLATKWALEDYPGLSRRHCATIAAVLYRDFNRTRDDVTVLVATYRQ
jgi:anti-sigma regulatory factor (Ser/Thr protein kinase)